MEKEHQPDSMATITMKAEYPPSEVYSASEPPPAYRHRMSSSVQIARIAAVTVVAASFILGSFILASSWVAARASCHQLEQLDAMLDKELALEGRAYGNDGLLPDEPLPVANAHALHGVPPPLTELPSRPKEDTLNQAESKTEEDRVEEKPFMMAFRPHLASAQPNQIDSQVKNNIDEDKLQKIDDDKNDQSSASDESDSDSSAEEDDDDLRPMLKMPIQFDLDDLAGAFLANNQKGRMNCVVERRHEEPMERRFPFNLLGAFAPRSSGGAERVAIICHGGDEPRSMGSFPEPQSQVFAFPLSGPSRLPLRPQERAQPAEPRLPFGPMHRPAPFPLPMPWDSSEEQMTAPREMRIHVQRVIAIPAPHNMPPPPPQDNMGFAPPPPQPHQQNEQPDVLHQFVPQSAPTQELEQPDVQKIQMDGGPMPMNLPWELTPEDIHVIQRTAAEAGQRRDQQQIDNDMQEVKTIVNSLAAAAEAEAQAQAQADARPSLPEQPRAPRTLLLPQDMPAEERPHYMQPRSVRSVDALLHREKRVKRCACNCA